MLASMLLVRDLQNQSMRFVVCPLFAQVEWASPSCVRRQSVGDVTLRACGCVMMTRSSCDSVPSDDSSSRPTSVSSTTRAWRINLKQNAPALKPDALDGALSLLRRGSQVAVTDSTAASVPQRPHIMARWDRVSEAAVSAGPGRVSEAQVKCPVVTEILDSRTQNILKVACCSYQVV